VLFLPHYSYGFAPANFLLFPELKTAISSIQQTVTRELKAIRNRRFLEHEFVA
jgi:hypothetical protein